MTITDLANTICTQCGMSDSDDTAAALLFLQRRLEMIWNTQLWRDSLIEATLTVNPDGTSTLADTVWIPSRSTLLLPAAMGSVLGVRMDTNTVSVASLESYYRNDADLLDWQGTPDQFQVLKSVVWEFATATAFAALSASAGVMQLTADGVSSQTASFGANVITALNALRIDRVSSASAVQLGPPFTPYAPMTWPAYIYTLAAAIEGVTMPTKWVLTGSTGSSMAGTVTYLPDPILYPAMQDGTTYQIVIQFGANGSYVATGATDNATMALHGLSLIYDRSAWDGSRALPAGYPATPPMVWTDLSSSAQITIPFYLDASCLTPWDLSLPDLPTFGVPFLADARASRARIRLTAAPQNSINLRILGKTECPVLAPFDSMPINNVEPCVLAFARSDMLLRQRQHGKAQLAMQEGAQLLAALAKSEAYQNASSFRIVPDNGFGGDTIHWTQPNSYHPL